MKRVRQIGLACLLILVTTTAIAGAQTLPAAAPPSPAGETPARFLKASGIDLVCYPARLLGVEGRWTFLLRGRGTLGVEGAILEVSGVRNPARRIVYPTPNAAVIDFTFAPQSASGSAQLILLDQPKGKEIARFAIAVESWPEPATARRQSGLVRLQLKPWTLLYPLHGTEIKDRALVDITGDPQFLGVLQDLGIEHVRKAVSRYAEDDSLHWNAQYQREDALGGDILRTYLLLTDPQRSEVAIKEIMLAFPQVQKAFVNADLNR
jgi:hypothetical protein